MNRFFCFHVGIDNKFEQGQRFLFCGWFEIDNENGVIEEWGGL